MPGAMGDALVRQCEALIPTAGARTATAGRPAARRDLQRA